MAAQPSAADASPAPSAPTDGASDNTRVGCRRVTGAWVVAAIVAVSFLIRLWNLNAPLLERHEFRQTQVGANVYWMLKEGLDPLHYQTPVFGPPWRLPMEFPIFQLTAALVARTGLVEIDAACRLTNIGYFYLSALMLYLVCRRHFAAPGASCAVALCYLWLPYTLVWSRTAMVDYAAVAFGLGYLHYFLRWLDGERGAGVVAATIAFGTLGYLGKVMHMTSIALALAGCILARLAGAVRGAGGVRRLVGRVGLRHSLLLSGVWLALALVPFLIGWQWIRYGDRMKNASSTTAFFASSNPQQRFWNFTTREQISDVRNWGIVLERIRSTFMPGVLLLFPLAAGAALGRWPRRSAAFTLIVVGAALAQMAIHFNLYVIHDYYLMGVAPLLALPIGLGIYEVFAGVLAGKLWPRLTLAAFIPLSLAVDGVGAYLKPSYGRAALLSWQTDDQSLFGDLSRALARVTRPEERIALADNHCNPRVLYYAERKGLMLWTREMLDWPGVRTMLKRPEFTTVALAQPFPELLALWKHAQIVETAGPFFIFRVSDDPIEPLPLRLRVDAQHNARACTALCNLEIGPGESGLKLHAKGGLPALQLPECDVAHAAALMVRVDMTAPVKTVAAVFFQTRAAREYSDSRLAAREVNAGRNTLYFRIPAADLCGRLRFDPARTPGDYVLHSLEVRAIPPL